MYPNKLRFCFENGYVWYFRYAGNSSLSNFLRRYGETQHYACIFVRKQVSMTIDIQVTPTMYFIRADNGKVVENFFSTSSLSLSSFLNAMALNLTLFSW